MTTTRDFDRRREALKPWRGWYRTADWRRIRERQLATKPLCERCERRGLVVIATVVNHVGRHGGDRAKFFGGPFESACKPCHDGEIQSEEKSGRRAVVIAADGWPVDPGGAL
jgi:hypothetical protein